MHTDVLHDVIELNKKKGLLAKRLNIVFLSHNFYPFIGGIESLSSMLATAFSAEGHNVHLMTWSSDPDCKEFPFKVIRDPSPLVLFREHMWADVVFENNPCLRLAWPRLFSGRPSVVGLQTWIASDDSRFSWHARLKRLWIRRATEVVACSHAIRRRCAPDAVVIANPYDESLFRILPNIRRCRDFVFVGRLVSDKGVDVAIKAFHQLLMSPSHYGGVTSFTIVGDGPERMKLQKMVNAIGVHDRVKFTGALRGEALVSILNQHRFIVVPSVWEEPFGIVALEGMACGCLPIVSDGGGLPEAVGDAGVTFKRGDYNSLAECMRRVLSNTALTDLLRHAALSHLAAHHCRRVSEQYLKIITGITA